MMDPEAARKEAAAMSRDSSGRYLKPKPTISSILSKFAKVSSGANASKDSKALSDETLVDIRVNNPLHKIVEILQEIKNQKAFTFNLKGSVGVMGVALVLVTGGIFGGNKILCTKGTQGRVGRVQVVSATQVVNDRPIWNRLKQLAGEAVLTKSEKIVFLVDKSNNVTRLLQSSQKYLEGFSGQYVIATGGYNACTQELQVMADGIEAYSPI